MVASQHDIWFTALATKACEVILGLEVKPLLKCMCARCTLLPSAPAVVCSSSFVAIGARPLTGIRAPLFLMSLIRSAANLAGVSEVFRAALFCFLIERFTICLTKTLERRVIHLRMRATVKSFQLGNMFAPGPNVGSSLLAIPLRILRSRCTPLSAQTVTATTLQAITNANPTQAGSAKLRNGFPSTLGIGANFARHVVTKNYCQVTPQVGA